MERILLVYRGKNRPLDRESEADEYLQEGLFFPPSRAASDEKDVKCDVEEHRPQSTMVSSYDFIIQLQVSI